MATVAINALGRIGRLVAVSVPISSEKAWDRTENRKRVVLDTMVEPRSSRMRCSWRAFLFWYVGGVVARLLTGEERKEPLQ